MSLPALSKIDDLLASGLQSLSQASDKPKLLELKAQVLGKKGGLSEILSGLRDASPEERKALGARANEAKLALERAFEERLYAMELAALNEKLKDDWIDLSLRPSRQAKGVHAAGLHPLTSLQRDLEDIFLSMGFSILDGPHIDDDFHNFEALNMPADHPARDMQDTFWFPDKKHLLRTQTSTIQIRGMKTHQAPFRFVGPGTVFRCERTDATHEMCFTQLEGMMVGENISVAHLLHFSKTLFNEIFQSSVELRVRPSYFPFVEPGLEIDINWDSVPNPAGRTGWMEIGGCGMVHPKVLALGGIDPEKYSGFAFGLGLDRIVMLRYGIDDIRHLHSGDLRFVSQFRQF